MFERVKHESIAGIFVGGRATRMGGRPKGLLVAPSGETIVARWRRLFEGIGVPVVLVGQDESYSGMGFDAIADTPSSSRSAANGGPMAGLVALLEHAGNRVAYCVACDMPYPSAALVDRLRSAPPVTVVAARRGDLWEPFFSRWDAAAASARVRAYAAAGGHRLQTLFDDLEATRLPLSAGEEQELRDWDAPDDIGHAR